MANGGIRTEAESRVEMNLNAMEPSLVLMQRDGFVRDFFCHIRRNDGQIRHAHLSGLIDEQVIQLLGKRLVGQYPDGTGGQVNRGAPGREKGFFVLDGVNTAAIELIAIPVRRFFQTGEGESVFLRTCFNRRQQTQRRFHCL